MLDVNRFSHHSQVALCELCASEPCRDWTEQDSVGMRPEDDLCVTVGLFPLPLLFKSHRLSDEAC